MYDNACNAQQYCVNREPWFFRYTQWYVDKFHWFNHTGCSGGFDLRRYPLLACVNSSVAEQYHSSLDRIRYETAVVMRAGLALRSLRPPNSVDRPAMSTCRGPG